MSEQTTQQKVINGVDVTLLFENIEAIKQSPHLGNFRFQLDNQWITCGHNRSNIQNFYGVGEDRSRREPFVLDADEPPLLLGTDKGPNPVEYLLKALASCVTTSLVYHAAARGIQLEEVQAHVEGDIDLRGFLGIDDTVPKGYQNIRMKFKIKADVADEQLEEICQLGPTFSPVFNTLTNGVSIDVELDR